MAIPTICIQISPLSVLGSVWAVFCLICMWTNMYGDFLKGIQSVCPLDQNGQVHSCVPTCSSSCSSSLNLNAPECLKTLLPAATTFGGREHLFVIPALCSKACRWIRPWSSEVLCLDCSLVSWRMFYCGIRKSSMHVFSLFLNLYRALCAKHCAKCFKWINSFNRHKTLGSRFYCHPHFIDEALGFREVK